MNKIEELVVSGGMGRDILLDLSQGVSELPSEALVGTEYSVDPRPAEYFLEREDTVLTEETRLGLLNRFRILRDEITVGLSDPWPAADFVGIEWTPRNDVADEPDDVFTKENTKRLQLLAKKYARESLGEPADLGREDNARLSILTSKIDELLPPITDDDLAQLEALTDHLEEASELDKKLRDEYGI